MDILVVRSISRIVMVVCGIGAIIYGIILINSQKEDAEKTEAAHKKGKSSILCGVVLWVSVLVYIFM